MKKNLLLIISLAVSGILIVSSCEKKPDPVPEPEVTVGAYILNSGNYGSNDSNLAFYNVETGNVSNGVFQKTNNKKLGDTAQDMIIFGSKMYIAVYNSQVIFVTDKDGKILDEIVVAGANANLSPRYLATYQDKVYVSFYEGYVGQIDTTSYDVKTVAVGANPDQIAVANGKLYVANSGGMSYPNYGKTVSVVNPAAMTLLKTLDVVDNPQYLEVDSQKDVYLISIGNYSDIAPTLQKINSYTDVVSVVAGISPTYMAMGANDSLYLVVSQYDAQWNVVNDYYVYDAVTETLGGKFITDNTEVKNAYYISVDSISNDVYIGSSDYISNGDMYIYTSKGVLVKKFDTGGLNPVGAFFLTE